jgi:hypothetical protein
MSKKILIVIIAIVIVSLGFGYRFFCENNKPEKVVISPLQEEKLNLSGEVKEITQDTIILISDGNNSEIFLEKETEAFRIKPVEKEKGVYIPVLETIVINDILIGEKVYIFVKQQGEKKIALSIIAQ